MLRLSPRFVLLAIAAALLGAITPFASELVWLVAMLLAVTGLGVLAWRGMVLAGRVPGVRGPTSPRPTRPRKPRATVTQITKVVAETGETKPVRRGPRPEAAAKPTPKPRVAKPRVAKPTAPKPATAKPAAPRRKPAATTPRRGPR